jgi:transcriptional regulator with XRE-family HTH domain
MLRNYKKLIEVQEHKLYRTGLQNSIGSIIRDERIKQQLTQGELAKGLCSVSYLSKIESGHYDRNNLYLQEIIQRLGIEVHRHQMFDYTPHLIKTSNLLYQMDAEGMRNLRSEFKEPVVAAEWLMEFANLTLRQEDPSEAIQHIDKARRTLSTLELHLFMILIGMHELSNYRTHNLRPVMDVLQMIKSDSLPLSVLSSWVQARYYVLLGKYTVAGYFLSLITSKFGPMVSDYWKMNVISTQLLMFGLANETQGASILIAQAESLGGRSEWYTYATAFYLMQDHNYTRAIQLFLQAKESHFGPSILGVIECCYRLGNFERMREYHNILLEEASGSMFEKIGYMFVLASDKDLEPLKNYITQIIHPLFQVSSFYYYHDLAICYAQEYFRSVSRYKKVDLLRVKR